MTAEQERAAVVEWLQERGFWWRSKGAYGNAYDIAAAAIEAGEHHKEGE